MVTFYKGAFSGCSWCNGRGCNQCHLERQRHKYPKPIFSAQIDDPLDMQLFKELFGHQALEHAFGPDGDGMKEIEQAVAIALLKQAIRKANPK